MAKLEERKLPPKRDILILKNITNKESLAARAAASRVSKSIKLNPRLAMSTLTPEAKAYVQTVREQHSEGLANELKSYFTSLPNEGVQVAIVRIATNKIDEILSDISAVETAPEFLLLEREQPKFNKLPEQPAKRYSRKRKEEENSSEDDTGNKTDNDEDALAEIDEISGE